MLAYFKTKLLFFLVKITEPYCKAREPRLEYWLDTCRGRIVRTHWTKDIKYIAAKQERKKDHDAVKNMQRACVTEGVDKVRWRQMTPMVTAKNYFNLNHTSFAGFLMLCFKVQLSHN